MGRQRLADGALYQTPIAGHYDTETRLESSDTVTPLLQSTEGHRDGSRKSLEDFLYRNDPRHRDDANGLAYEVTRVKVENEYIAACRRLVLFTGNCCYEKDLPIHVRATEMTMRNYLWRDVLGHTVRRSQYSFRVERAWRRIQEN